MKCTEQKIMARPSFLKKLRMKISSRIYSIHYEYFNQSHQAFKKAMKKLDEAGGDINQLSKPVRTFIRVNSAQGIIDNGGYKYFFSADYNNDTPCYSEFTDAYYEIGCSKQANELKRVISTFPFTDPHLKLEERKTYIEENYDDDKFKISGWGDALCGDKEVWLRLEEYYIKYKKIFV